MQMRQECWPILAWFFDNAEGHPEPVMSIRCIDQSDPDIAISVLKVTNTGYSEVNSKSFPLENVRCFCHWLFAKMSEGSRDVAWRPESKTSDWSGTITLPGERYYWTALSYPHPYGEGWNVEIFFSKHGRLSPYVVNRIQAEKIVRNHEVEGNFDDKTLFSIATALKKAESAFKPAS